MTKRSDTITELFSPMPPCPECLTNSETCRQEKNTGVISVYCHHYNAGAIFDPTWQRWTTTTPIQFDDFKDLLNRAVQQAAILQ